MDNDDSTRNPKPSAMVARFMSQTANPPGSETQCLMQMMKEWLESVVIDAGTEVDYGGGHGGCDLALFMNGQRVYVNITQADPEVFRKMLEDSQRDDDEG